jgi:hypothetical protein
MTRLLAALLLLAASGAAQTATASAIVSERPDRIAVTIYHEGVVHTAELMESASRGDGLAMVSETRGVDLPDGDSVIQFRGVAATMVPETADIAGFSDEIRERNFDYGLLSPATLLEKSIGETVHLVRTDRKTGKVTDEAATVLTGPNGAILKIGNRYEALGCSGLPERLVFDRIPDGLLDQPTWSVRVHAAKAGRYTLLLRYIATGVNWSADYVARVNPDGRTLDLSGWITLANISETGFSQASVDVIAGHVQTTGDDQPHEVEERAVQNTCWPTQINWAKIHALFGFAAPPPAKAMRADAPAMEQVAVSASRIEARDLGDLKQYPLPETTDVAAKQSKQVQFLDQTAVPFERIYAYRPDEGAMEQPDAVLPATILLRLHNTQKEGLGKPLPAGQIATMVASRTDEPLLAEQGDMRDTAVGLPLEIRAGQTSQVLAQPRVARATRAGSGDRQRAIREMEVTLTNQKPGPVTVEWREIRSGGATVADERRAHGTRDGDFVWTVKLDPGERNMLRYTLDIPG